MKFSAQMYLQKILYLFLAYCIPIASADNKTALSDSKVQIINGQITIILDTKTQLLSDIKTAPLIATKLKNEFSAFGKAISAQPLFELQHRYAMALSDRNRATVRFNQSDINRKRQQDLYQFGITSKYRLQEQQAQANADKTILDASSFQDQAIVYETKLKWGEVIGSWVLSNSATKLNEFLTGQQTLLQITLPVKKRLSHIKTILVEPSGNRDNAELAELISTTPLTDNSIQGLSYFFKTRSKIIKPGMNITAWIADTQEQSGVIIPKSALIWVIGQACVYIKTGDNSFLRQALTDYSSTINGYYTSQSLTPNQQVVIIGAETLLSEELHAQIPDDN